MAHEIQLSLQDVRVRLIRLRNALGSQKALAAKAQISESYLSDVLAGRRGIPDALLELVEVEFWPQYRGKRGWKP